METDSKKPLVLMLDFLQTAEVEQQVLDGVAQVVCCNATSADELPQDLVCYL